MAEYLTIQEFSKLSGIEASTLRYWDEIGLFTPLTRNPENQYRCYSTVQLLALNFVTTLSELEIPLKTIAALREERNPDHLLDLLEKQEKQMDMEMRNLRLRYSIIHARRELINIGVKKNTPEISIVQKDEMSMFLWPQNEYNDDDTFLEPLAAHVAILDEAYINLSFPVGGYYDNIESLIESPARPDRFISIDPVGTHKQKAGDYLIGYVRGYYGELGDLPERMAEYATENSIHVTGPAYIIYLLDEFSTKDPELYLAQISIATKKSRH